MNESGIRQLIREEIEKRLVESSHSSTPYTMIGIKCADTIGEKGVKMLELVDDLIFGVEMYLDTYEEDVDYPTQRNLVKHVIEQIRELAAQGGL